MDESYSIQAPSSSCIKKNETTEVVSQKSNFEGSPHSSLPFSYGPEEVLLMDKTWRSRVFGQGRTRSGGPRLCADRSGAKNSTPLWSIFDAKSELFEFGFCALSILLINNSDVLLLISISVQIF